MIVIYTIAFTVQTSFSSIHDVDTSPRPIVHYPLFSIEFLPFRDLSGIRARLHTSFLFTPVNI